MHQHWRVVEVGGQVAFPNYDKVFHNVFSVTEGSAFDLGLYRAGESKTVEFPVAGEVEVYCNIHPDMSARVLVLPNGYFAEADASGTYRIEGVPFGAHTVVAWTADHVPVEQSVTVAGDPATLDFELRKRPWQTHTDKKGKPYGRYR